MKIIQLLICFLALPIMALAEYNGHQIEFQIEFRDGSELQAYSYLATVYRKDEDLSYQEYLEQNYEIVLNNQFNDSVGEYAYHAHRLKYEYVDLYGNSGSIYTLLDKRKLEIAEVKSFKIIEMIEQSYAVGISSEHSLKDTLWMSNQVMERFSFGGVFCSNDIYIHEKNTKTEELIARLQQASDQLEQRFKEEEDILKYSDGTPHYQAEARIEQLEEESDRIISEILQGFNGEKVVIITTCTC